MSLIKKNLLVIGLTLAGLIGLLTLASNIIVLGGFARLEADDARQNVGRVEDALTNQIATLDSKISDWSSWDDTYAFIQDHNQAYIDSNLSSSSLSDLKLNLMLFVDLSAHMVYSTGLDLDSGQPDLPPAELPAQLTLDSPLLAQADSTKHVSGILLLPKDLLQIVSQPILTSGKTGPAQGTLIAGR
jgi:sensor domain CHASE-containing protein